MDKNKTKVVIEALKSFYSRYKRMPTIKWIEHYTKYSNKDVDEVIQYLIKKGKLTENSISSSKKKTFIINISDKIDKFINNSIFIIFRIIAAIIGFVCIYESILLTNTFLQTFFTDQSAFRLSVSMVSFVIISFNVRPFLIKLGKIKLARLFFILGIITISYSMVSTLAVQTNTLMEKEELLSVDFSQEKNDVKLYNKNLKQIDNFQLEIKSKREERTNYKKLINKKEEMDEEYLKLDSWITKKNKEINNLMKKKENLEKENTGLLKNNVKLSKKEKMTIFQWFSKILFNSNPYMIQFVLYSLPAIFIDIVGTLCINIALFLRQKRVEE